MNSFYVYCYKHPETLLPFYIGKGSKDRSTFHLRLISSNLHKNKYFANVVKQIKSQNLNPIIEMIKENLSEIEAYNLEEDLISLYGRKLYDKDGILCNLTKGGRGAIGYKHTDETKEKLKLSKSFISQETRQKLSLARLGKKDTLETIKKRSDKTRGISKDSTNMKKPKSESHRLAISIAQSGSNCPRAKDWIVISPNGDSYSITSLKTFCQIHNLQVSTLSLSAARNKPVAGGVSKGWQAFRPANPIKPY